ncbi:MAG: glycoside hydrolase family 5 protein [Bacteroidales bacterium]|nr:glycoside hydrolase family 5 protein [Bacteroidales bacterium]MCM1416588.1 glycoside hydrolase family 5 protein [bacterium]MCM1422856.1 glycoside hydrolase family 5 protein [bacterium]
MKRKIKMAAIGMVILLTGMAVTGCGTAENDLQAANNETAEAVDTDAPVEEADLQEGDAAAAEPADPGEEEAVAKEAADAGEDMPETESADGEEVEAAEAEPAADAVRNMRIGWNLGNTLDATGDWIPKSAHGNIAKFETAWGNPVTPPTLMPKLKTLGFGAVRIPITWNYHFDEEGNIDAVWMARVKELVDQAIAADLYCIINIHHDTGSDGWLRASKANYEKNQAVFARLWEQIATEFKDYPDTLVFEGFNEMLDENSEWNDPGPEAVEVINLYNQLFVDTVRSTGKNNETRNLICCTYAAATGHSVIDGFQLPKDSAQGHLIAETHFYAPYEFITDEGVTWTTPLKEYTDYVEQQIDEVFLRLEQRFTDQNVPLIIGEFATIDKDNTEERVKWYTHVIEKAKELNAPCFIWDNGNGFNMGHIDREGDADAFPQIIEACIKAADEN